MSDLSVAEPSFAHMLAMTDDIGLFEHAVLAEPAVEHGYCVDDVARGLIVLCRAADPDVAPAQALTAGPLALDLRSADELAEVAWRYLRFLVRAQGPDGRIINRCDVHGVQHGNYAIEDSWGRALWGLGTAASRHRDVALAELASARFDLSATLRSPWPRAMAFAGLGAAELLRVDSSHASARALLADAAVAVGLSNPDPEWPWPEPRLTYANAVVPDVLLAAGDYLNDGALVEHGLLLLGWLLDVQTADEHLSLTANTGWALGEPRPGFDQQPIEAATLADACARAFELTGEPQWSQAVDRAAAWFLGSNDVSIALYDPSTGGSCDGLKPDGRNENQGAESTLALISTLQHAHRQALALR